MRSVGVFLAATEDLCNNWKPLNTPLGRFISPHSPQESFTAVLHSRIKIIALVSPLTSVSPSCVSAL